MTDLTVTSIIPLTIPTEIEYQQDLTNLQRISKKGINC
jgi:hypothetical protein